MNLLSRIESLLEELSHFPWKTTAHTLRERFREDQLGVTAGSLTYTTTLALVPFFTVALAVFTAFPIFAKVQQVLQQWLLQSLVPDAIAHQLLGYLTLFASKASRLGVVGMAFVLVSALALILTIDRTLNRIWRVKVPRALGRRVMIYWAGLTLGPLLLGSSLLLTSYVISASKGVVNDMPGGVHFLLDFLEFLLLSGGMAALFRYVPNTQVKWAHAWAGGLFVGVGIDLAKRVLAVYIGKMSTYSVVYGAFAVVPILLFWIYVAWVIVLLGAVIAAYLPSLLLGVARRGGTPGWPFQLAVEIVQQLQLAGQSAEKGLSLAELAQRLRVDALQLEASIEALVVLDWVQALDEQRPDGSARLILLVDPAQTRMAPLAEKLLLVQADSVQGLWGSSAWQDLRLSAVVAPAVPWKA